MSATASLLLLHGEEAYLVDRDARAWLEAARAAALSDLDVEIFDNVARLDGVRRSLISVPFLADRRYVMLRDAPQLAERARRGADSAEGLAAALRERSPQTEVCVVAHQRIAPQHPVLALARSDGRVVEHRKLRGRELRAHAERVAASRGVRMPAGAVELLLRRSGGDLGVIDNEVAKLASYASDQRPLTLDDVRRVVAGAEQVAMWDVLERLLTAPHGAGAAALEALMADGTSPQQLMSVLARQLREIIEAQEIAGRSGGGGGRPGAVVSSRVIESEMGLQPWQAERLARWAALTPPGAAEAWLRALARVDAQSKLGKADDAAGLRVIGLRAARTARAGAR